MQPSFGGSGVSGTVADRINAMRSRAGLPNLDASAMDAEAIATQRASDRGDFPFVSQQGTDDAFYGESTYPGAPETSALGSVARTPEEAKRQAEGRAQMERAYREMERAERTAPGGHEDAPPAAMPRGRVPAGPMPPSDPRRTGSLRQTKHSSTAGVAWGASPACAVVKPPSEEGGEETYAYKQCDFPTWATGNWHFWNLIAPLPYALYLGYTRNRDDSIAKSNPTGAAMSVRKAEILGISKCCGSLWTGVDEDDDRLENGIQPYGDYGSTWDMYKRHGRWALALSLTGAALGSYHSYRRGNDWKRTAVWGIAGASFPLIAAGVALFQGFPKYKKPGQTKRPRQNVRSTKK